MHVGIHTESLIAVPMPDTLVVILIAVLVVALFVVAMSLTLIFKGHNIRSEISQNDELRRRGIKCAVQEAREEALGGTDCAGEGLCGEENCASCSVTERIRQSAGQTAGEDASHGRG